MSIKYDDDHTWEDIGEDFGFSRQYAQYVGDRAIAKIANAADLRAKNGDQSNLAYEAWRLRELLEMFDDQLTFYPGMAPGCRWTASHIVQPGEDSTVDLDDDER